MMDGSNRWALLPKILPLYAEIIGALAGAGAEWIQIDEPVLVTDLDDATREAFRKAYAALADSPAKLLLATYFGAVGDNFGSLAALAGCRRACRSGARAGAAGSGVRRRCRADRILSLGLVDGRNIWKTALTDAESLIERAPANCVAAI